MRGNRWLAVIAPLLAVLAACKADAGATPGAADAAAPMPKPDAAAPPLAAPDAAVSPEAPVTVPPPPADATAPELPPPPPVDTAPPSETAPEVAAGGTILVYSHTTGNRHESIPRAVATVRKALVDRGYTVEASEDPAWFTEARLRGLYAIVLVSTTGRQLGDPGTAALAAFEAWVRGGGILIGLHAASSTFYDPEGPYTRLIGGKFVEHPGGVRSGACHKIGEHPAVAKLPTPFVTRDEIYVMSNVRADNQLILTCDGVDGKKLPIAWHRPEGAGRVFYTALGHLDTDFAPDAPYFRDHALPGMLWALGR